MSSIDDYRRRLSLALSGSLQEKADCITLQSVLVCLLRVCTRAAADEARKEGYQVHLYRLGFEKERVELCGSYHQESIYLSARCL
jgi:hypothetical protein